MKITLSTRHSHISDITLLLHVIRCLYIDNTDSDHSQIFGFAPLSTEHSMCNGMAPDSMVETDYNLCHPCVWIDR